MVEGTINPPPLIDIKTAEAEVATAMTIGATPMLENIREETTEQAVVKDLHTREEFLEVLKGETAMVVIIAVVVDTIDKMMVVADAGLLTFSLVLKDMKITVLTHQKPGLTKGVHHSTLVKLVQEHLDTT